MITTICIITSVMLAAMADGFNDRGWKDAGHTLEAVEKVTLLLGGLFSGTWIVVIAYVAFRVALFDLIRNLAKGDPILYLGQASLWDRFFSMWQPVGLIFTRVLFLTLAISVSIRHYSILANC